MHLGICIILFSIILCLDLQGNPENNGDSKPNTNLKKAVNYLLGGLKNLARIGRIFKWEKVFFEEPENRIDEIKINTNEKMIIFKLAQLSLLTYDIKSLNDHKLIDTYTQAIKNYKNLNDIIKIRKDRWNESLFEIYYSKPKFFSNSLSGIVFSTNKVTVIAFKGTSPSLLGYDTDSTSKNDKVFDNILFDCDLNLKKLNKLLYLDDARKIYFDVKQRFPKNTILLTGHSMGAAVASIIGHFFDEYVVAFGTPGDRQIIKNLKRLKSNIKKKEARTGVLSHFFKRMKSNTVHISDCRDAIFRGACNGLIDVCKLSGYEIKTKCHSGASLCFDNEGGLSLFKHTIFNLVEKLKNTKLKFYKIDENNCNESKCKKDSTDIF